MELLSTTQFDIRECCGNIVVLYTHDRVDDVAKLKDLLDYAGYAYVCHPVGAEYALRRDFKEDERMLDGCACFIPVLSESLRQPENQLYRSVFWYYAGYMRARSNDSIVPYYPQKDKDDKFDMSSTPLQGLDILYSSDALMQTISNKYSSRLLCHNYYENRAVNMYASRRIFYRCLRFKFVLRETCFRNAKEFYKEYTSRNITDNAFDEYLLENIVCGCRVVSFGNENLLTPPLMPYRDEVHPYITDYPQTIRGKKSYVLYNEEKQAETGIHAEMYMDVILPIHKLLGTFYKCYITCEDADVPVFLPLALFESDFTGEEAEDYGDELIEDSASWYAIYPDTVHIDEKLRRFYFDTELKNVNPVTPDPDLGIGESIDYIYPQ